MDEQHNPSHQPVGTDQEAHQPQPAPAQEAPGGQQAHEAQPPQAVQTAQASAEPQQPKADTAEQPETAAAQPEAAGKQPQAASARPEAASAQPQAASEGRAHAANADEAAAAETAAAGAAVQEQPPAGAKDETGKDQRDFAQILADFEQGKNAAPQAGGPETAGGGAGTAPAASHGVPATPSVGQKVKGKVLSITGDQVFVDLGTKSEGMIEAAQLRNAEGELTVKVGDSLDAQVTAIDPESGVIVLRKKASGGRGGHQEVATELRQAFQYGMPVEGLVTGINKGGAEVQVYGMRAFCPLSQLDLRYVENPQQFIGQRLKFKVSRIEEGGRNRRPDVVLSRRALLEEEAQAKAAELRARLQIGAVLKGRVTSLTTYGAFVDLEIGRASCR